MLCTAGKGGGLHGGVAPCGGGCRKAQAAGVKCNAAPLPSTRAGFLPSDDSSPAARLLLRLGCAGCKAGRARAESRTEESGTAHALPCSSPAGERGRKRESERRLLAERPSHSACGLPPRASPAGERPFCPLPVARRRDVPTFPGRRGLAEGQRARRLAGSKAAAGMEPSAMAARQRLEGAVDRWGLRDVERGEACVCGGSESEFVVLGGVGEANSNDRAGLGG